MIVHRNISALAAAEAERRGLTPTEPAIAETQIQVTNPAAADRMARQSDDATAIAAPGEDPVEAPTATDSGDPTGASDQPAPVENSQVYHRLVAEVGPRIAQDLAARAHARAAREQLPTDTEAAAQRLFEIADDILAEHRTAMAHLDDAAGNERTPTKQKRPDPFTVFHTPRDDHPPVNPDAASAHDSHHNPIPAKGPVRKTPWRTSDSAKPEPDTPSRAVDNDAPEPVPGAPAARVTRNDAPPDQRREQIPEQLNHPAAQATDGAEPQAQPRSHTPWSDQRHQPYGGSGAQSAAAPETATPARPQRRPTRIHGRPPP